MPDRRLLIVEDENIVARDLQSTLQRLGYAVLPPVATAAAAVAQAEAERPDLVLMDIALRGQPDGIEAAARIHEQLHLPVVFLTAHADDATLERAQVTEPFGYVLKPFDERELQTAIRMAIYKHQTEQELRRNRQWLDVTLRSIGDAVIATDTEGRVVLMNPVAERLSGWPEADAAGRTLEEVFRIINEQTRQPVDNPVRRVLREGVIVGLANHTLLVARDGSERPIDDSAAPIRDVDGSILGVVLVFRDVTERRQMEAALSERAQQLEEANRRKDEFLAMLAHELRNPLAPIRTGIDLLSDREDSEVIDLMRYQTEHLVRLVDDLLDVSRLMRERSELHRQTVRLQDVVQRAVSGMRPLVASHQQVLDVEMASEPIVLDADPIRLVQVLGNLLNNASKFTPGGGRIRVRVERQGERGVISVRDDGIGIEAELLPRVFDLFTQADQSLERTRGGLGIGLTLVRRLVELHGGEVVALSDGRGRGSEFRVSLPVRTAEEDVPRAAAPAPPRAEPGPLPPRRVLVVDDNAASATMLVALLERVWKHEATTAHDGSAALEAARRFRPHVVLLDIGLPGLNGYEVARQLRQDRDFDDVLLVAVSGYGTQADQERGRQAGFDHYLVKPPSVDQLRDVLWQSPTR